MKIIGHQKQWQFLKKLAESGKIPHSLLFEGGEKLGKSNAAFEFIKLLFCQEKDFSKRPCQNCRACQDMEKKQHPDLILIEQIKKEIQIFQIRELILKLALKPYTATIKTAILDQAHLMTRDAQGCLLKTLEEPKGNALLILITDTPRALLPTIISRVQKLKFFPVNRVEIEDYLKEKGFEEEKAKELTLLCQGRPGIAVDFISEPDILGFQEKRAADFVKISRADLAVRFQYAKDLAEEGGRLKETLEIWLNYLRRVLLQIINNQQPSEIKYSLPKIKNIINFCQKTNFLISTTNINPKLALEILMLEL